MNKELIAKIIEGKAVFFPRKKRGQSRGEFLANVQAANRLNGVDNSVVETVKKSEPAQLKLFDFDSKV